MCQKLKRVASQIDEMLRAERVTIDATPNENMIIRDMDSGEEMLLDDLGYPI